MKSLSNKQLIILTVVLVILCIIVDVMIVMQQRSNSELLESVDRLEQGADAYPALAEGGSYGDIVNTYNTDAGRIRSLNTADGSYYALARYINDAFFQKLYAENGYEYGASLRQQAMEEERASLGALTEHADKVDGLLSDLSSDDQ